MVELTLCLVGDLIPTRRLPSKLGGNAEVFNAISAAQVSVGNFEISLSEKRTPVEKVLHIGAAPEIASDVQKFGVRVLTLANNHSVDQGWAALRETQQLLSAEGIGVIGIGENDEESRSPWVSTLGGATIGVVPFSCLLPPGTAAGQSRPGISSIRIDTAYEVDPLYQMEEPGDIGAVRIRTAAREDDVRCACAAIGDLKKRCDFVVVTVHWGFGSGDNLADYQWPLAKAFIDAGASLVHGHHPHAIHPVGFYRGRPVFFSLGTLIGQQVFLDASEKVKALWAEMSADGCLAFVHLDDVGRTGIEVRPTILDENRLPAFATGREFDRILERLSRLCAPMGTSVTEAGGRIIVRPAE